MAVSNSLVKKSNKVGFTAYLTEEAVKNQINSIVGGKNGTRFITSIVSAVNANPALQECTNKSILTAALVGESLNLSPSPQLGFFYLVPYNTKDEGKVAQFQIGYKGYIQLAIRSGQYKKLNVMAIKEGELIRFNPLTEEIEVRLIEDEEEREDTPTAGYYACFEYLNGFRKAMYWSKRKMLKYADKYVPAFSLNATRVRTKSGERTKVSYEDYLANKYDPNDAWMYSSHWYTDFEEMAFKTMLRQLISKWGIMSAEFITAMDADMAVINEDGTRTYVETEEPIEGTASEVKAPEPEPVKAPEPTAQEEDEITQMLFGGDNV